MCGAPWANIFAKLTYFIIIINCTWQSHCPIWTSKSSDYDATAMLDLASPASSGTPGLAAARLQPSDDLLRSHCRLPVVMNERVGEYFIAHKSIRFRIIIKMVVKILKAVQSRFIGS